MKSKEYLELLILYEKMIPYYSICNGGDFPSDIYLLPYEETKEATEEFIAEMSKEELLRDKPTGEVICSCANGDVVILSEDGTVKRVSHEISDTITTWESLVYFMSDAFEEL